MQGDRPRRITAADGKNKVAGYLALRRLRRLVLANYERIAVPDEDSFWADAEFNFINKKKADERDRLNLSNLLGRINHCPNPNLWLRWYYQFEHGKVTFAHFVKKIISTRKG